MPLTQEQAFKVGFLQKCAEDGLTIEETKQRVKLAIQLIRANREKQATIPIIGPAAGWLANTASNLGSRALGWLPGIASTGMTLGLVAPVALGGLGGYVAAKGTSGGSDAVDAAKQDEITGEYERLADEARRRARLKRLQSLTGRRVIALTPGDS